MKKKQLHEALAVPLTKLSSANRFILNGLLVWLDKATRVGLINSTTIERDLR